MNRTIVKIDLNQYKQNLQHIKNNLISPTTKLLCVVKANAYGHGILRIAKTAIKNGADYLGVARLSEALELRQNGITHPILLLSEPKAEFITEIVKLDITQTVYTTHFAKTLNDAAEKLGKNAIVHIKIDTGMNRLGYPFDDSLSYIKAVSKYQNIIIEGLYTHLAIAENTDSSYTDFQLIRFRDLVNQVKDLGIRISIIHAANSAATLNYSGSHFDMVRIGILSFQNVLTLSSYLGHIKFVKKGAPISYNCRYSPAKDTFIGIVFCGYSDSIPVSLSNKGQVIINNRYYPIVGQICMDLLMVDLGNKYQLPKLDSEVVLLGKQGDHQITVEDICKITKQIPYEVLCGLKANSNRLYIE